jgi:hypothetical protein
MATPERLNALLRQRPVPDHHTARVGEALDIQLPRMALTAETQFVGLTAALDNPSVIELLDGPDTLEGAMLPRVVHARAVQQGRSVISVRAVDPFSGAPIVGVEPVKIVIDVKS